MLRGWHSCACSIHAKPSSTPFPPYHFLYRFRPSFNCPAFLHFTKRTDSHTEPSSLYPLSPLSLPMPYRKTGGGGRSGPFFSPLATRHSPLSLSPIIPAHPGDSPVTPIIPALLPRAFSAKGTRPRLTPIIPALTVHSPASPIIPALTRPPGGRGPLPNPNLQVILYIYLPT
jgi:hypothetical protein